MHSHAHPSPSTTTLRQAKMQRIPISLLPSASTRAAGAGASRRCRRRLATSWFKPEHLLQRCSFSPFSSSSGRGGEDTEGTTVGFIGLGQMGSRMAANLLAKSPHPLLVYDASAPAMAALEAKGALPAGSLEELAARSEVVVTMLPATRHVEAVLEGGVLAHARKGALLVDSSTIDPNASKRLNALAAEKGLQMVDAPVSGGVGGAEAGTLTFMCGGEPSAVDKAKHAVLQYMGKNVVHCGGPGTGEIAKICNNLVLGVNMAGVAEAMNLGVRLGIDPQVLNAVMNTSSGRSWVTEVYSPCPGVVPTAPASKGYAGGFAAALMQKDLGIAADAARAVGAPLPMAALAQQVYALLTSHGQGGRDFAVLYEFLQGAGQGEGKGKDKTGGGGGGSSSSSSSSSS